MQIGLSKLEGFGEDDEEEELEEQPEEQDECVVFGTALDVLLWDDYEHD